MAEEHNKAELQSPAPEDAASANTDTPVPVPVPVPVPQDTVAASPSVPAPVPVASVDNTGVSESKDHVGPTEKVEKSERIQRQSMMKKAMTTRSTRDIRTFSRAGYVSMVSIKRGSLASFQDRQKQPKYMNSYKLNSENPFNPDKVKSIIIKIIQENIDTEMAYDVDTCPDKAKHISASIRQKVKEQDFDRYKLVCVVTIGEKKSHDILTAVRFLWDSERDRYATYFYENMYIFLVATVFGIYYE